ncbi:hypothetical protein DENSPDRAFT_522711 [Dentipellis sp. KUC8613]|nr:hypothetical protein DENSPDRAFT_522711 [Dentipellis sp. KUC8613]
MLSRESMSSPNTLNGPNAFKSSWPGGSAHGGSYFHSCRLSVDSYCLLISGSTACAQRISVHSGIPLNQWGLPSCSYRYHMLHLEDLEIEETIKKISQDFDKGVLDFNQWSLLVEHWRDRERAIAEKMDEETKTGPQSLNEVLQSWGYTNEQAELVFRRNLDMRLENRARSRHHLFGRNTRGD